MRYMGVKKMPTVTTAITKNFKSIILYLDELESIESKIKSMKLSDYIKIKFKLGNADFAVDSIHELVTEMNKINVKELSYLEFSTFGFNLTIIPNGTLLQLKRSNKTSEKKFFQISRFLGTKQIEFDETHIYLFPKPQHIEKLSDLEKQTTLSELNHNQDVLIGKESRRVLKEILAQTDKLPEWLTTPYKDEEENIPEWLSNPEYIDSKKPSYPEFVIKPSNEVPGLITNKSEDTKVFIFSNHVWTIIGVIATIVAAIVAIIALFKM